MHSDASGGLAGIGVPSAPCPTTLFQTSRRKVCQNQASVKGCTMGFYVAQPPSAVDKEGFARALAPPGARRQDARSTIAVVTVSDGPMFPHRGSANKRRLASRSRPARRPCPELDSGSSLSLSPVFCDALSLQRALNPPAMGVDSPLPFGVLAGNVIVFSQIAFGASLYHPKNHRHPRSHVPSSDRIMSSAGSPFPAPSISTGSAPHSTRRPRFRRPQPVSSRPEA